MTAKFSRTKLSRQSEASCNMPAVDLAGLCLNHMAHHLSQRSDRWKHPVGFARVPPISIDKLPEHARALLGEK